MADKSQTVWIIIEEIGEYSAYFAIICSVWDTKEAAEICINKLREEEKKEDTPNWVTKETGYSLVEVPLNKPGNYWPGQD